MQQQPSRYLEDGTVAVSLWATVLNAFELGSTRGWGPSRTKSDPRIGRINTNDMKKDGRSAGSLEGFVNVHRVDHNYVEGL
jgi:hypothetical protein